MGTHFRPGPLNPPVPVSHLYLHLPFCERICPYCDFSTAVAAGSDPAVFPGLLTREAERFLSDGTLPGTRGGEVPSTLLIGGGTPSWYPADELSGILREVSEWTGGGWTEATLEMNPEHADTERIRALAEGGVTRLSLGAQSFDRAILRSLGRVHIPEQVEQAVRFGRSAGLTISFDLLFAVPGQTLESWQSDVEASVALGPDHLSLYNLTYEEGTPFHRWRGAGRIRPLEEAWGAEAYSWAVGRLAAEGYARYEVGNFAREGCRSRHSLAYWTGAEYLGLGPSAHSLVGGMRTANAFSLAEWSRRVSERGSAWVETEVLDERTRARERVLLGVRLSDGLLLTELPNDLRAGVREAAQPLADRGLLRLEDDRIVLTDDGMLFADAVAAQIAP